MFVLQSETKAKNETSIGFHGGWFVLRLFTWWLVCPAFIYMVAGLSCVYLHVDGMLGTTLAKVVEITSQFGFRRLVHTLPAFGEGGMHCSTQGERHTNIVL